MTAFYLGTHMPNWLDHDAIPADVPLFISHRRLAGRKTLPKARGRWALDSGGFTELKMYGDWDRVPPATYVAEVRRYDDEIGGLDWAAPQDWMCEPVVISGGTFLGQRFVGTHLTVAEHQRRTVDNFVQLSELWGNDDTNPFMPVLQGFARDDYLRCWELYDTAGITLTDYPVIGLGSVCRRQAEDEIGDIVGSLQTTDSRLPLHGFGVKLRGLEKYGHLLGTADSLAWSFDARRAKPLDGCATHINCANCPIYALQWRDKALTALTPASAA
jgi:hypothetical protein